MPAVLRRLPIPTQDELAFVAGEQVRLRSHQIILWVNVAPKSTVEISPSVPPFPVILDTGHSHNFSIRHQHLTRWAGVDPIRLSPLGRLRERGDRVPLHEAVIFLHQNVPGRIEPDPNRRPFRVPLTRGIAVHPEGDYPRLPLIGMRALVENRLRLTVNGDRRTVSLTAPPHWWPFGAARP